MPQLRRLSLPVFALAFSFVFAACNSGSSSKSMPKETAKEKKKPFIIHKGWTCKDVNEHPKFNTIRTFTAEDFEIDPVNKTRVISVQYLLLVGDKDENLTEYSYGYSYTDAANRPKVESIYRNGSEALTVKHLRNENSNQDNVEVTNLVTGEMTRLTCDKDSDEETLPKNERTERDRARILSVKNFYGAHAVNKIFFSDDGSVRILLGDHHEPNKTELVGTWQFEKTLMTFSFEPNVQYRVRVQMDLFDKIVETVTLDPVDSTLPSKLPRGQIYIFSCEEDDHC